jgi:bifunctional non-homologous end joining protein LigD
MKFSVFIRPMTAKTAEKPFDDKDWLFELKLDGYRAIAEVAKSSVKFYSRNGLSFAEDYPEIFTCLIDLGLKAVFDGEIVALDDKGRPSFQLLQKHGTDPGIQVYYYVFDLLELDGNDLRHTPLIERKNTLKGLLGTDSCIRYVDHIEKRGQDFFKLIAEMEIEGVMAKKRSGLYHEGLRSADWLKIKNLHEQEAVIIGFTAPGGSRQYFGSLLLGVYEKGKLFYAGNVGTGFNEDVLKQLYMQMKPLETDRPPVKNRINAHSGVTWIKPVLVANVKFTEWTEDGYMRHPVYLGLRKDKSPLEVVKEQ